MFDSAGSEGLQGTPVPLPRCCDPLLDCTGTSAASRDAASLKGRLSARLMHSSAGKSLSCRFANRKLELPSQQRRLGREICSSTFIPSAIQCKSNPTEKELLLAHSFVSSLSSSSSLNTFSLYSVPKAAAAAGQSIMGFTASAEKSDNLH